MKSIQLSRLDAPGLESYCDNCQEPYIAASLRQKYCSDACRLEANEKKKAKLQEKEKFIDHMAICSPAFNGKKGVY